jgi:hypothetical protein
MGMIRPPAVAQTEGVVEAKLTGKPELAFAVIGNGERPKILLGIASNEIVCDSPVTVKLWTTFAAAA